MRQCEQVQEGFAAQHYPEAVVAASLIGEQRFVARVTIPAGVSIDVIGSTRVAGRFTLS